MIHRKDTSCSDEYLITRFPRLLWQSFYSLLCGLFHCFRVIISLAFSYNSQGRRRLWLRSCCALSGLFGAFGRFTPMLKGLMISSALTVKRKWRASLISLLLLLCWPLQSFASVEIPTQFKACAVHQADIEKAVKRRFPRDFQYPAVWRAQLYQESLCDPSASSHAGAGGIAQFMRGTQREVGKRLGIDFDRYNARQAIDAGAYYQNRVTHTFRRRNRTPEQAYELGAASYNSGLGNVLKSQRLCNNARLWDDIAPCQNKVTGRHAAETITYVSRIKRWTNEAEDARPWNVPAGWRKTVTAPRRQALYDALPVRRWFTGQSWCTYFPLWGGWATAGHCLDEVRAAGTPPPFLDGLEVKHAPFVIDAALYGVSFPKNSPALMIEGESIETIGFPAGSDALTYRKGRAYFKRADGGDAYEHGGFIVVLETGPRPTLEREPVVGGQSGSPGLNAKGDPVCIVVNQNSLTDLTGDGRADNSFDCVALSDVWVVLK